MEILLDQVIELKSIAKTAMKASYSPYSKFKVGAAILTDTGKVFSGTNVENVSYGLTMCAERSAVFSALTAGKLSIKALCVHVQGDETVLPCGACLQVLSEFIEKDLYMIGTCDSGDLYTGFLSELYNEKFTREKFKLS